LTEKKKKVGLAITLKFSYGNHGFMEMKIFDELTRTHRKISILWKNVKRLEDFSSNHIDKYLSIFLSFLF